MDVTRGAGGLFGGLLGFQGAKGGEQTADPESTREGGRKERGKETSSG